MKNALLLLLLFITIRSTSQIRPETPVRAAEQSNEAPRSLSLPDGTTISEADLKSIIFRWHPVNPSSKEAVTYRLKIWQFMEGQNREQAMQNRPLVSKDVQNAAEAEVVNLVSGPCKAPYLCSFIWNVQALTRDGKSIGSNNGTSESNTFKISPAQNAGDPAGVRPPGTPQNPLVCGTVTSSMTIRCAGTDPGTNLPIYTISITLTNTSANTSGACSVIYNTFTATTGGNIVSANIAFPLIIPSNASTTITFAYIPPASGISLASFNMSGGWNAASNTPVSTQVRVSLPDCAAAAAACECSEDKWETEQKVLYSNRNGTANIAVASLGRLPEKALSGTLIEYNAPAYVCATANCNATYEWKVINVITGVVYSTGTTASLPFKFAAPAGSADYQLIVTPLCGTKTCAFSGFYFSTLQCIKVGQNYGGGIVFFVDDSCEHGLIATTTDQSAGIPFFSTQTTFSGLQSFTGSALGTGNANTVQIRMYDYLFWSTSYMLWAYPVNDAAMICENLVLNGYSDWYLPSKDELNLMYTNKNFIAGFTTGEYWSSSIYWLSYSDNPYRYAWFQKFSNGNQGYVDWHLQKRVRAIRSF